MCIRDSFFNILKSCVVPRALLTARIKPVKKQTINKVLMVCRFFFLNNMTFVGFAGVRFPVRWHRQPVSDWQSLRQVSMSSHSFYVFHDIVLCKSEISCIPDCDVQRQFVPVPIADYTAFVLSSMDNALRLYAESPSSDIAAWFQESLYQLWCGHSCW